MLKSCRDGSYICMDGSIGMDISINVCVCVHVYMCLCARPGIDQPNMMHGSTFLLPVDVTVKVDCDKWPSFGDNATKKARSRKGVKGWFFVLHTFPFYEDDINLETGMFCIQSKHLYSIRCYSK